MFTTLVTQPIFNILVLIYAILPGHNFGVAIILFTILVRLAMFPLLKKQLRNSVAMRSIMPEVKKIKAATKGDRQREQIMTMELYKERGINPFSSIGLLIVQIPLFLAMYGGLKRIVDNPQNLIDFSYGFVNNLPWMKELAANISLFDNTLLGVVDLSRAALTSNGGVYWAGMIIVIGSTLIQWLQIKQTMPVDKDARKLRVILKDAGEGKEADASEVNAAVSRNMSYVFPILIFFLTVNFASAFALYWFVGSLVAYFQQAYLLRQDEYDIEKLNAKYEAQNAAREARKSVESKAKTAGPKAKSKGKQAKKRR